VTNSKTLMLRSSYNDLKEFIKVTDIVPGSTGAALLFGGYHLRDRK
jgi:hypothetical protein